jgi:L,D-transpeptidase YcbB
MKYLWSTLIILLGLAQCQGRTKHGNMLPTPVVRDTTITPANAFTSLVMDSLRMESFIREQALSDTKANQLRQFYNLRNYQYAWFTEDGLAEHTPAYWNRLINYLKASNDSTLYNQALFRQMQYLDSGDTLLNVQHAQTALMELALTHSFFTFAKKAYEGTLDPQELQWHIPRKKVDAVALLDSLAKEEQLTLKEIEPLSQGYKALRKELLRYYTLEKETPWEPLSLQGEKSYRKGDKGPVVDTLKERLAALGDLKQVDTTALYNDTMVKAVRQFQRRHGLKADGVVGPNVLKALNISIEQRIEQLLINMERQRWLPPQPEGRWIMANIPEFKVHMYEGRNEVLNMNIVVGKAATRTVVFADELKYVVFSPYWNLPRSIVRNEILPAMDRNPGYLQRKNMEITGYSNGLPVIRQKPGPGNALGKVKFLFPNQYSIYFHDTPAKSLFERQRRAFSHGCIRLQEPFKMAQYLLGDQSGWTDEQILQAMNRDSEKWVTLTDSVSVFITYLTAWVDSEGQLNFREDIYGHDRKMAAKLFAHTMHQNR